MSVSMCSVASMDWDVTSLILSLIGCQRTFEILINSGVTVAEIS